MTLHTRISKLEDRLGADDLDRWVRSLTDDELAEETALIRSELRRRLTAFDVNCENIPSEEVAERLETLEKAAGQ